MLFRITNGQNVTVIVEKMLEFLCISEDDHTTIDLVGKVAELAEKYPLKCNLLKCSFIITPEALWSCKMLWLRNQS